MDAAASRLSPAVAADRQEDKFEMILVTLYKLCVVVILETLGLLTRNNSFAVTPDQSEQPRRRRQAASRAKEVRSARQFQNSYKSGAAAVSARVPEHLRGKDGVKQQTRNSTAIAAVIRWASLSFLLDAFNHMLLGERDTEPLFFLSFQAIKTQRLHQHSDQNRPREPRGVQDLRQPEHFRKQQRRRRRRRPVGAEEALEVLPGNAELCGGEAPLPRRRAEEVVVPAADASAADGGGGDCRRAPELLLLSEMSGAPVQCT